MATQRWVSFLLQPGLSPCDDEVSLWANANIHARRCKFPCSCVICKQSPNG